MKKVVLWMCGLMIGLIGGFIVHTINVDFEFAEILPAWFIVLEFGVPLIAAVCITLSSSIIVEIEDRFWQILWAYLRIVLVVALVSAIVFVVSFLWSLIAYGIATGELFGAIFAVVLIGGALGGGTTIIIRIFMG